MEDEEKDPIFDMRVELKHGFDMSAVTNIEDLYQAFKARLVAELKLKDDPYVSSTEFDRMSF